MIRLFKLIVILTITFLVSCNTKNKDKKDIEESVSDTDQRDVRDIIEKKASKIFYLKDEISLPANDNIFYTGENEVVLFRPTENDLGILLEETQDQALLDLDGNFEALTNQIIINYSANENVKISICEKPMIAISQENDTLYFDTSKDRYGLIFCKSKNQRPIYKMAQEKNLIQLIKDEYNL